METDKKEGFEFIDLMSRKWKVIVIALLVSVIGATIVTATFSKEYYSYGIVFPANTNSVEASIDNPNVGYDLEADRLMQILQSDLVFDSVLSHFELDVYYGYDRSKKEWRDELREEYVRDVTFTRTQFMSIVIGAQTTDSKLSKDIVNYIIDLVDILRDRFYKRNLQSAYDVLKKELHNQELTVDSLEKKVSLLRSQTDVELMLMPNSQYVIQTKSNRVDAKITTSLERTMNRYVYEQFRFNELSERFEKAKSQYERPVTYIYVVDRAKESFKKVYPSYTLNILLASVLTVLFTVFYLMFSDRIRLLRAKN
jgi:capsular polysaccharide biosynthesis protein